MMSENVSLSHQKVQIVVFINSCSIPGISILGSRGGISSWKEAFSLLLLPYSALLSWTQYRSSYYQAILALPSGGGELSSRSVHLSNPIQSHAWLLASLISQKLAWLPFFHTSAALSLLPSFLWLKVSSQDVHIFTSQISSARTSLEMDGTLDIDLPFFTSQISSARTSLEMDGTLDFDCYSLSHDHGPRSPPKGSWGCF